MYYFFEPLLDEEGKQVVRVPKYGEWIVLPSGRIFEIEEDAIIAEYPILTMKKFDEDPLKEIRGVYGRLRNIPISRVRNSPFDSDAMWQAIVKVVERVEGK